MKKSKVIGLVVIILVLVFGFGIYLYEDGLFGMGEKVLNGESIVSGGSDEVDTSDWKTFESEELGIRFRYPGGYELMGVQKELKGFDKGKRLLISFNNINNKHRLNLAFFSDDFSEGIGEGLPIYFNPLYENEDDIKKFFSQHIDIDEFEFLEIKGKKFFRILGSGGYIKEDNNVIYGSSGYLKYSGLRNFVLVFSGDSLDKIDDIKNIANNIFSSIK